MLKFIEHIYNRQVLVDPLTKGLPSTKPVIPNLKGGIKKNNFSRLST